MFGYREKCYWERTETAAPLEMKYTQLGPYETKCITIELPNSICQVLSVYFPIHLPKQSFPLIVVANGTGVKASDYLDFFRHLASWGFVVAGNEDPNSRSGLSASETLERLLMENADPASKLHGMIDPKSIGIAGQSQGGVAAINAVTNHENGKLYRAVYTASMTSAFWGQPDKLGTDWQYDMSQLRIPCLMIAGTGFLDAGLATDMAAQEGQGISPLYALESNYEQIPKNTTKIMARRAGIDHGDILNASDGYMTAWFLWHLKKDSCAEGIFSGTNAELLSNPLYQDVHIQIR